jgi:hypothetical protein
MRRDLGAGPLRIDGAQMAVDDVVVDRVLEIRSDVRIIEVQGGVIRRVLSEESSQ